MSLADELTETPAPPWRSNVRWALLVSAFAMIPLLPTLRAAFVYDDAAIIRDNVLLRGWGSLLRVWSAEYWPIGGSGLYRPVHLALLALVWNAGGGRAIWFHAYALIVAAITAIAVWWLARRAVTASAALVAATWFATHPLHVEATASVANSSELLVVLSTIALVMLRRGEEAGRGQHSPTRAEVAGVALLAAIALLSKESGALALPLAALTAWGWRRSAEPWRVFLRERRMFWVAGAAAVACVFVMRRAVLGAGGARVSVIAPGLGGLTWYGRWSLVASLWRKNAAMMMWPSHLAPYYGPTILPTARGLLAAVGMAVAAGGAYVAVRLARRGDTRLLVAAAWVALTWLPASNLFAPTGPLLADRTLFGATVGVALALAWVVDQLRGRVRTAAMIVVLAIATRNAMETATYARDWTSHRLLWTRLVRNVPAEHLGYRLLGMDARARGDTTEAIRLLARAYALAPSDAATQFELGQTLYARGRFEEAARVLAPLMSNGDAQGRPELVAMYLDAVGRARGAPAVVLAARSLLGTRADGVASEYLRAAQRRASGGGR